MKSGFIAIVGRPNAGKSTLLNSLLGEKIAIITEKAQTTRNAITGILNGEDYQLIFVDTPGLHEAKTNLGTYMNKAAYAEAYGADVIYYVCDVHKGISDDDRIILDNLFGYDLPVFFVLNKIDEVSPEKIMERLAYASKAYPFKELVPISALNKDNLNELLKTTLSYLDEGVQYYPDDMKTNMTDSFRIAEIIREKVILNTYEEVPHLCAVKIDELKFTDTKVFIEASIVCNKDTHKGIIIGKHGAMLQKINMAASKDLKALYGKKVILSLYVKVDTDWLNSSRELFELGYFEEKE